MKRIRNVIWVTSVAALLAACGVADKNDEVSVQSVTVKDNPAAYEPPGAARGPFEVDYEIIGTPIVGNPVTVHNCDWCRRGEPRADSPRTQH